jgi:2-polyprenyl-6-methoxyphenol hydroxylase-like FAD-dependent oxidoreductase
MRFKRRCSAWWRTPLGWHSSLARGSAVSPLVWPCSVLGGVCGFSSAPRPRALGFALLLAPNALASLRSLGLAETVIAAGAIPAKGEMRGRGGRLLRSFDMTAARTLLPEPIVVVLRPVLHGALLEAVGRDAVAFDSPVVGFDIGDRRPATVRPARRR